MNEHIYSWSILSDLELKVLRAVEPEQEDTAYRLEEYGEDKVLRDRGHQDTVHPGMVHLGAAHPEGTAALQGGVDSRPVLLDIQGYKELLDKDMDGVHGDMV